MGIITFQLLYYPYNLSGIFGIGLCLGLGGFQAMMGISSEHNCTKKNKNKLFSTVLG